MGSTIEFNKMSVKLSTDQDYRAPQRLGLADPLEPQLGPAIEGL